MDKSLFIFIAVGIGFIYFITGFIGDIQEKDENYQNKGYQEGHKYDQYRSVDSIGQEILELTGADEATQLAAWKESKLKDEFLELFPDFSNMKRFAKERIRGDILQNKLSRLIDDVENKYFSGTIDSEQAKRELGLLK